MTEQKLTAFQQSLICALFEQQRQYRIGEWSFGGTIHSKASYTMAMTAGKLRRSPAKGRWNMERAFEQRFNKAVARLVKLELAEWRSIRTPDQPAGYVQGYKRHKARNRDLFLTIAGLARAESALKQRGVMAVEIASCDALSVPTGPVSGGMSGCDD